MSSKSTYCQLLVICLNFLRLVSPNENDNSTQNSDKLSIEEFAMKMYNNFEVETGKYCHKSIRAVWNFETNLTTVNEEKLVMSSVSHSAIAVPLLILFAVNPSLTGDETRKAGELLERFESVASQVCNEMEMAFWNFKTNITTENLRKMIEENVKASTFKKEAQIAFNSFDWRQFKNDTLKRLFQKLTQLGEEALPDDKLAQLKTAINNMTVIISTTEICDFQDETKCDLKLNPDIENIMASSRNYEELLHIWKQWHDITGLVIRDIYPDYVSLLNEAAILNNFTDAGEMWRSIYESTTFTEDIDDLWQQVKPLYEQLHSYVRRKLINIYGEDKIRSDGPIPAHLLGNMWAQEWNSLLDITKPFPNKTNLDLTETMIVMGFNVHDMFHLSETFFTSLGLQELPDTFFNLSMLERPKDRNVQCQASAWDFCNGQDFRVKMCAKVTMQDLFTIHHEMGHIQYEQQYRYQPLTFREGANPGFHEAIGDTILLSVSTLSHLAEIGIIENITDDFENELNQLFETALMRVAFLPFAYVVDQWRWKVFSGEITPEQYNSQWWQMRKVHQGIEPSIPRTQDNFDPGAKSHVASSVPYIKYFVSEILTFQFHEALCLKAGLFDPSDPNKPLHKCNIYGSTEAGQALSEMMKLGSSKPWPDALEQLTGQRKMNSNSLLNYFAPLMEFLTQENLKNNNYIGWRDQENLIENQQTTNSPQTLESRSSANKLINSCITFLFAAFLAFPSKY